MKNKVIFVGKDGRPSMRLVYSKMHDGSIVVRRRVMRRGMLRKTYYRVYNDNVDAIDCKDRINPIEPKSTVIRWGTREVINNDGNLIYNQAAAIAKGTDKKSARLLMEQDGVSVPKRVDPANLAHDDFPIIARPSIHAKGRNFVTLNTEDEFIEHYINHWDDGWYYSAFVDKEREFRVHCAHGKVLAVMEKPKADKIAWNRAINEDPFVYVPWNDLDNKKMKGIMVEALKAIDSLGLDFGGVDVMMYKGKPYVLEVNTSPTLASSDYVASRWAKYFDWLFRSEERRPHWDYKKFVKGKSLLWKNGQLLEE